jgi:hypothetical protein
MSGENEILYMIRGMFPWSKVIKQVMSIEHKDHKK